MITLRDESFYSQGICHLYPIIWTMKRAVATDRKPSLKVQTVQRWGNKAKWRGSRATRRSSLEISPESRPNAACPQNFKNLWNGPGLRNFCQELIWTSKGQNDFENNKFWQWQFYRFFGSSNSNSHQFSDTVLLTRLSLPCMQKAEWLFQGFAYRDRHSPLAPNSQLGGTYLLLTFWFNVLHWCVPIQKLRIHLG